MLELLVLRVLVVVLALLALALVLVAGPAELMVPLKAVQAPEAPQVLQAQAQALQAADHSTLDLLASLTHRLAQDSKPVPTRARGFKPKVQHKAQDKAPDNRPTERTMVQAQQVVHRPKPMDKASGAARDKPVKDRPFKDNKRARRTRSPLHRIVTGTPTQTQMHSTPALKAHHSLDTTMGCGMATSNQHPVRTRSHKQTRTQMHSTKSQQTRKT